jgi:hypothetical protein
MKTFKDIRESNIEIDEAPLVANDMDILGTLFDKIKDDMFKNKRKKQGEKNWPNMQILSKMAGYGLTKKGQDKDRSFRYDLKK